MSRDCGQVLIYSWQHLSAWVACTAMGATDCTADVLLDHLQDLDLPTILNGRLIRAPIIIIMFTVPCKSRRLDSPRVKFDHYSTHTSVSSILPSLIQRIHSATNTLLPHHMLTRLSTYKLCVQKIHRGTVCFNGKHPFWFSFISPREKMIRFAQNFQ